jgi:tetratricopeptide (TPR) repeat protein
MPMISKACAHTLMRSAVLSLFLLLISAALNAGVWLSSISGSSVDEAGMPLSNAILRFTDPANGRHFEVTTAGDGHFNYIAVQPSRYTLEVIRARHQAVKFPDIYLEWSTRPLLLNIDLLANSVRVTRQVILAEAYGADLPVPSQAAAGGADETARAVNAKIAATKRFIDAGDWDSAITAAKAATEIDANRDLSWAWLATAFCEEARHNPESASVSQQGCIRNYKTAIAISPQAAYFNNLGAAYAALNDWAAAAEQFRSAQKSSPESVSLYHLNLGSALLKQSELQATSNSTDLLQSAATEFAIAVSSAPAMNEAYYWQGLCEIRLAGMEVSGSTFDKARASFERYLQLVPNGPYASDSRAMLDALNNSQWRPDRP